MTQSSSYMANYPNDNHILTSLFRHNTHRTAQCYHYESTSLFSTRENNLCWTILRCSRFHRPRRRLPLFYLPQTENLTTNFTASPRDLSFMGIVFQYRHFSSRTIFSSTVANKNTIFIFYDHHQRNAIKICILSATLSLIHFYIYYLLNIFMAEEKRREACEMTKMKNTIPR